MTKSIGNDWVMFLFPRAAGCADTTTFVAGDSIFSADVTGNFIAFTSLRDIVQEKSCKSRRSPSVAFHRMFVRCYTGEVVRFRGSRCIWYCAAASMLR